MLQSTSEEDLFFPYSLSYFVVLFATDGFFLQVSPRLFSKFFKPEGFDTASNYMFCLSSGTVRATYMSELNVCLRPGASEQAGQSGR